MYKTYKTVQDLSIETGKTWSDMCFRLPIVKVDMSQFLSRKRREISSEEDDFINNFDGFGEDEDFIPEFDPSTTSSYPDPYCRIVESMDTACYMYSILELWANDGKFDEASEAAIASLTLEDVIEKVNSGNTRQDSKNMF